MRVSDRLELISKIGRDLQSRYTFDQLYSYLLAFEIPLMEDGPSTSKWSYTKAVLDTQPLEKIIAIGEDLEIDTPTAQIKVREPRNWKGTKNFRLFISHIAKHKGKATRLKEALSRYSINGFVAHEDIHPTLEWQKEVERALYTMDAMVAIHTPGFSESYWTQQEIGFALGRGIKVVSLKMGEDPKGFISVRQALPRRNRKAEEIAVEINSLLLDDPLTRTQLEEAVETVHRKKSIDEIPF